MKTLRLILIASILFGALIPAAQAADKPNPWSLARAIPSDCWLYTHVTRNEERGFFFNHWNTVYQALRETGIDQDVKSLIAAQITDSEDQASFNTHWDNMIQKISAVNWSDLAYHEFVFAQRWGEFTGDNVLLFKPKAESLDANLKGLVDILQEIASLKSDMNVTTQTINGAEVWTLQFEGVPISLNLFHHKDIIGITTNSVPNRLTSMISVPRKDVTGGTSGPSITADVVTLLNGQNSLTALVDTPRFKEAIQAAPPAEDFITFVDVHALWKGLDQIIQRAVARSTPPQADTAEVPSEGQPNPSLSSDQQAVKVIKSLIAELDFVDYIIETDQTLDLQTKTSTVCKLLPDADQKPLCKILTSAKPMEGFDKYIPQKATGYWAWSGLDWEGVYHFVLDFIKNNVPDGESAIAQWDTFRQEHEFDPQEKIFSWFDGQMISFTMQPEIQTAFGSSDWVFLLKVKDEQKASEILNNILDSISAKTESDDEQAAPQMVMVAPASEVHADGFRSVMYAPLAMMGKITVGVNGGWMMVGNSSSSINQCLATAKGESPSILENKRFQKEGLTPKGPVVMSSFKDLRTMGQQLAMICGMAPMMTMGVPQGPEGMTVRKIAAIVGKLSRPLAKIDFMKSSSSLCTFKKDRWEITSITTYKEYVPPTETPVAPTTESPSKENPKETKPKLDGL